MLTCLHLPTYYCNITLQGILILLFMVLLWGIDGYIHSLRGSDTKAPEIIVALEILRLESDPLFSLILRSICGSSAHSLGSKKYGGRPCLILSGSSSIISFLWYSQSLEVGVICRFVSLAAVKKTSSKGSPASFFASSLRILFSSILSGQSYALMTSFARGRGPSGISCRFLKMWCLTLAS